MNKDKFKNKKAFTFIETIISIIMLFVISASSYYSYFLANDIYNNSLKETSSNIDYDNLYNYVRNTAYDSLKTSSQLIKYSDDVYYSLTIKETIGGSESFRKNITINIYDKNKEYITSLYATKIRLKGYIIETLNSTLLGDNYLTVWLSTNDREVGNFYIAKKADGGWGARYSINALMDTHNKYYYIHAKVENMEGPCETDYGLMGNVTLPENSKYRFVYSNYGRTIDATIPEHWRASNTSFDTIGYEPTKPVRYHSNAWGWGLWSSGECHKSAYFSSALERMSEDANEF